MSSVLSFQNTQGSVAVADEPARSTPRAPSNLPLAALPAEDYQRLSPHLKFIELSQGFVFQQEGTAIEHVYFPDEGMASMVLTARDGTGIEVGMVGQEGIVGTRAILGGGSSLPLSMMQIAGRGWQMPVEVFRDECQRGGLFQELVLAHLELTLAEATQSVLCNRLHNVDERLSRWLLAVSDRIQSDDIRLTHEFIAQMLGTRRSGVTVAAGVLQQAGMIRYRRGHIIILDREAMEETACECYGVIRDQYESLVKRALQRRSGQDRWKDKRPLEVIPKPNHLLPSR